MTNMTTHPSQPGAKTVAQLSIEQLIETVERHANGSRAVGNIAIGDALLRASSFLRAETGQVFAAHAQSQARIAELADAPRGMVDNACAACETCEHTGRLIVPVTDKEWRAHCEATHRATLALNNPPQ
jgi:hypothetical protein